MTRTTPKTTLGVAYSVGGHVFGAARIVWRFVYPLLKLRARQSADAHPYGVSRGPALARNIRSLLRP